MRTPERDLVSDFSPSADAGLTAEQREISELRRQLAAATRSQEVSEANARRHRQAARDLIATQYAAHIAARTDSLTNLANTRRFHEVVSRAAEDLQRPKSLRIASGEHALIIIDLDGFKAINDNHGHLAGDQALQVAAHALINIMRGSDQVMRIGGDEFAILMHDTTIQGAVGKVRSIEKMFDQLTFTFIPADNEKSPVQLRIGGSAGMCMMDPGLSINEVKAHADERLYASKARRKNPGSSPSPEAFA